MHLKQNIQYLDTLRALATIGVIIIHVSTPIVKMSFPNHLDDWWVGNLIDSGMRFCVPLFLILSGATLLNKEYKLVDFYKKRFMRVLLPFLFWVVVYVIYTWFIVGVKERPYTFEAGITWFLKICKEKGISTHFWFIYMLLVLYLFLPFIGKWVRRLSNKSLLIVLLIWFVFNTFYQFKVFDISDLRVLKKVLFYFQFAGFLVMGYALFKIDFSALKFKIGGLFFYLASLSFVAFYTYYLSESAHKLNLTHYYYLSPFSILQTLGVYMLFANTNPTNKAFVYVRDIISEYSYGIYLVHIIVIGIFFLNGIFWTMAPPLISVPIVAILVLLVSYGLIFLLRKVPGGKYIAG